MHAVNLKIIVVTTTTASEVTMLILSIAVTFRPILGLSL